MDYRFENIPVDSGLILISDKNHYDTWGLKKPPSYSVPIKNGKYKATWAIPSAKVSGKGTLEISSGDMWVGDPGYMVLDRKWDKYLEANIWPEEKPEGVLILDKHGGDGSFTVLLKLEEL